jgi:hypothetical protein
MPQDRVQASKKKKRKRVSTVYGYLLYQGLRPARVEINIRVDGPDTFRHSARLVTKLFGQAKVEYFNLSLGGFALKHDVFKLEICVLPTIYGTKKKKGFEHDDASQRSVRHGTTTTTTINIL